MGIDINVDDLSCALTGYCVKAAPEIFEIVEGQKCVHVKTPHLDDADAIAHARDAENSCPTAAILIEG